MFPADGGPADVGLGVPNALLSTISCLKFGQSPEFQRTLSNKTSSRNISERTAADSNDIASSNRTLPDRPRLLGAFVDGQLQGLLEFCRANAPDHSEVALVVAPDRRRKGLAWALLRGAMRLGLQAHPGSIRMVFPRDNWPMRKIACKANAQPDVVLDEIHAIVPLTSLHDQRCTETTVGRYG